MATCAACGLAIRNGERYGRLGPIWIHQLCVSIPYEVWPKSVEADTENRRLRAEVTRLRDEVDLARRELEAQTAVLEREIADLRSSNTAASMAALQRVVQTAGARRSDTRDGTIARQAADLNAARTRIKELEAELAAARAAGPVRGQEQDNSLDDTEARFALLELDAGPLEDGTGG